MIEASFFVILSKSIQLFMEGRLQIRHYASLGHRLLLSRIKRPFFLAVFYSILGRLPERERERERETDRQTERERERESYVRTAS